MRPKHRQQQQQQKRCLPDNDRLNKEDAVPRKLQADHAHDGEKKPFKTKHGAGGRVVKAAQARAQSLLLFDIFLFHIYAYQCSLAHKKVL